MNTKYVLLIAVLSAVFLFSGCLGQSSKPVGNVTQNETVTTQNVTKTSATPSPSNLELAVRIPDTINVGEQLKGSYYMKYNGAPFEGIILYCGSREGFKGGKFCSMARGNIENVDFDKSGGWVSTNGVMQTLNVALQAFRLNENGYSCCMDYFYDGGDYTYSISVYDCATIEKELNKTDCGGDLKQETLFGIQPFKSESKTITVTGESIKPECKTSTDCTKLCEGCTKEKQICEQSKEICMDCFMNSMCKSGYKCEQNKCVIK